MTIILFFGSAKISEKAIPANFYLFIFPRENNGYQQFLFNDHSNSELHWAQLQGKCQVMQQPGRATRLVISRVGGDKKK
jgi:hypothetical protein